MNEILIQDIIVDLTESQNVVIYANQYDSSGRIINCHIQDKGVDFDCTDFTVKLWIKKSNGLGFSRTIGVDGFGSIDGNIVTFPIETEMTYYEGRQECYFSIQQDEKITLPTDIDTIHEYITEDKSYLETITEEVGKEKYTIGCYVLNKTNGLIFECIEPPYALPPSESWEDIETGKKFIKNTYFWKNVGEAIVRNEVNINSSAFYIKVRRTTLQQEDVMDSDDYQTFHDEYLELKGLIENVSAETPDNIVLYAEDEEIIELPTATGGSSSSIVIDSELSTTSTNPVQNKVVTAKLNEVFQSVSNGKSIIASAITDKGIETDANATFETMANNVMQIDTNSASIYAGQLVYSSRRYKGVIVDTVGIAIYKEDE